MKPWRAALMVLLLQTVAVRNAVARETDKAHPGALVREAKALIAKGKYAEACPKLAESHRLRPGLGTLLSLARCYEQNGQTASAWSTYAKAESNARLAEQPKRASAAHAGVVELSPRVGKLRLVLPSGADEWQDVVALVDGEEAPLDALVSGLPVDQGSHFVELRARGKKPWTVTASTEDEQTTELSVPALEDIEVKRAGVERPSAAAAARTVAPSQSSNAGSGNRVAAIALGGVGAAALGISGYFLISSQKSYDDAASLCTARGVCTERGVELRDTAKTKATIATLSAGAGVAALVSATVFFLTKPTRERPREAASLRVLPHDGDVGLSVDGTF
jgi:hypothetical protein